MQELDIRGAAAGPQLVWSVADNNSIAGHLVAAAFRPPPVRVALKGDATPRSAETTEDFPRGRGGLQAATRMCRPEGRRYVPFGRNHGRLPPWSRRPSGRHPYMSP
jgi:hypothetical protein